jgi:hypothetical protein
VNVSDRFTTSEITDPDRLRTLDGLSYQEMLVSEFINDDQLNELEISGGGIALRFESETSRLRVVTEFSARRKLRKAELAKLVAETEGQWSDGIGEDAASLFPGMDPSIHLDFGFGESELRVEQTAESKQARPRRTLAQAAKKGEIGKLRKALEAGEDVNSESGGVAALKLAIMSGHPDAAIFLVEQGADLAPPAVGGYSPLVGCASWLAEADAIRVAAAILAKGGNAEISVAYDTASSKWKMELARFLVENGADPHHRAKKLQQELERRRFEDLRRARRDR